MQNRPPELQPEIVGNSTIVVSEQLRAWGYVQFCELLRNCVELTPVEESSTIESV